MVDYDAIRFDGIDPVFKVRANGKNIMINLDLEDEIEMSLRSKQLDYVLIFSKDDKEEAIKMKEILDSIIVKGKNFEGRLYDDAKPFSTWTMKNTIERRNDLFKRSTFKFFLVSNNLAKDIEFIFEKNEAVQHELHRRDQSIIPIWLVRKYDLTDEAFDALFGITSLQGLDPETSYFKVKLEKMAQMSQFVDKKNERAKAQERTLEHYLLEKLQLHTASTVKMNPRSPSSRLLKQEEDTERCRPPILPCRASDLETDGLDLQLHIQPYNTHFKTEACIRMAGMMHHPLSDLGGNVVYAF